MRKSRSSITGLLVAALTLLLNGEPVLAAPLETTAADLASKLSAACPPSSRDGGAAFERCSAAMHRLTGIPFAPGILWGGDQPQVRMAKKQLTHFAPVVYQDMYMPLFWFTGKWSVGHDDLTNLDVIRIEAYYRNALPSGDYPYPFWHSADKWTAYETANELRFYIGSDDKIVAVTRGSGGSEEARGRYAHVNPPVFDGNWQWTDANGQLQPHASLFSANFSPANPVLPALDVAYRDFALNIRQGTCVSCHTPANRTQMDHLVLLQTPMHASGEIDDALKMVSQGDMPRDDVGNRKPLDPILRDAILKSGATFRDVLAEAKKWEADHLQP